MFDLEHKRHGRLLKWALIVAAWTFLGVLTGGETYVRNRSAGGSLTLTQSLLWYLAWSYTWATFTPVVLWLRRRFPFQQNRWVSSFAVHLSASLLIAWLGAVVYILVGQGLGQIPVGLHEVIGRSLMTWVVFLHFDPALYWIIIGLSYGLQQYRERREKELRASQLETQLAQARLQALEMQLHPHFLFNALHTIAVLIRTHKNAQAVRVVTGLGELLRRVLDGAGSQTVPLKQELEFIRRYLEIEQLRFGDRLQVEICVEPEVQEARVPHLILQPLVENALRHGIAPRSAKGRLRLEARRDGGVLRLSVRDDGPGAKSGGAGGTEGGLGLTTTRERLRQLFGDGATFEAGDAPGGGFIVSLAIPFQVIADEAERYA